MHRIQILCCRFRQYDCERTIRGLWDFKKVQRDFLRTVLVRGKSRFFLLQRKEHIMKENYQKDIAEILAGYELKETAYVNNGLTKDDVKKRKEIYGQNILEEGKKKHPLVIFLEQFKDLLVIILIIAALISMASGSVESTIVIFVVLILNGILGTVQYLKAEKSLDSLKALSSPHAKVIRDGEKIQVLSKDIVPGDLLLLEAGDMVVADGRILKNYSLQVNESSLTGESTNVDKSENIEGYEEGMDIPLADRKNMVYSGTLVTYGRADVLVTETAMNTEMGKIAGLMNATKEKTTPLQRSLDEFSKKLAIAIMIISVIVLGLRLYQGEAILDAMMFAVALAVAAIPEALSSIVTIVQAMGTQKMAQDNAIIKELKAVESLGCVSVICSDKTGTLTQNKMTVEYIYIGNNSIPVGEINLSKSSDAKNIKEACSSLDYKKEDLASRLILASILCNDSAIADNELEIGDPTETALIALARKLKISDTELRETILRTDEIPFDSDRKLMTTGHELMGSKIIFTKGALDVLLNRSTCIAMGNGVVPITDTHKEAILKQNQEYSRQGLRVLSFGYKEYSGNDPLTPDKEIGYIFLGLIAMMDPPRLESAQAVKEAIEAGIKPVMITGDHKITATAIAKRIGIFSEGDIALTGQELDAMTDEKLDEILHKVSVYARVSPENKIRIVERWQEKGNIVAMTGDGVNDAPALKKADIGVAMGITGTEVSKDAASMILMDDNFATIIKAVLNGRNVYRNIKNAIGFLLSGNLAAILAVLYCSIMALPTPFEPVHLLFINLLTDSLPALAIGMESADSGLLKQPPRNPKEGILKKDFALQLLGYGTLIAIVSMAAFYMGLKSSPITASTMAFATLTLARLFHGFNCRSNLPLTKLGLTTNVWSLGAFVVGSLLLVLVLTVPLLARLFLVASLNIEQMVWILILAVLPTLIVQIKRMI